MSKATKQVTLSTSFRKAAAEDEEAALGFMLMAAFGVDLMTCFGIVKRAVESNDRKIIIMMLTSGVQIRGNVVFVGREFAGVQTKYPELVIVGSSDRTDIFNFSALHVCGHIVARLLSIDIGKKVLKKAGDCTTGDGCTENEAGKINKEIASSWSVEQKAAFESGLMALKAAHGVTVDEIIRSIIAAVPAFAAKLTVV